MSVRPGSWAELSTDPTIMAGSVTDSTRLERPLSKAAVVRCAFLQPYPVPMMRKSTTI